MERFICANCRKKRNINFLGVKAKIIGQQDVKICVTCWDHVFDCDKSKLVRINYDYENIILNKRDVQE